MVINEAVLRIMMKIFYGIICILFCSSVLYGQTNDALLLGNPSNAVTDLTQPDNYLVTHNGYALSYNKSRGSANWVAWHLEKSNIGTAERTNAFAPDTTLPREWWIVPSDYTGSGYDRGHMLPSKDRSDTEEANRVTFFMSNMQPQTPNLNQKTWKYLEDYTRELVNKGNEAYIYAGCYGDKGRIKDKVTLPTNCFKIIVILPDGDDDLKRIYDMTRVIAVDMPNDDSVSIRWRSYITTVDDIEQKTGFDFLSNVSEKIQREIESKKDEEETPQATTPTGKSNSKDGREYFTGSRGGCYYLTASGNKTYVDKSYCENTQTETKSDSAKAPETNQPPSKKTSGDREYFTGARGGCYYLTASGNKKYVDNSFCSQVTEPTKETNKAKPKEPETKQPEKTNSDGRTYLKGSRGGCYYLTASGKKVYVDKEKCEQ